MSEETPEEILAIDPNLLPKPLLSMTNVMKMYDPENTISDTAQAIGIDRSQLSRWCRDGIHILEAEKLAQKIGLHPAYIWGPEYHIAVYMLEIVSGLRYEQRLARQKIKRKKKNAKKEIHA